MERDPHHQSRYQPETPDCPINRPVFNSDFALLQAKGVAKLLYASFQVEANSRKETVANKLDKYGLL